MRRVIGRRPRPISGRPSDSNRGRSACGRLVAVRTLPRLGPECCPLCPRLLPGRCSPAPPACRQDGPQADLLLRQVLRRALRVPVSGLAGVGVGSVSEGGSALRWASVHSWSGRRVGAGAQPSPRLCGPGRPSLFVWSARMTSRAGMALLQGGRRKGGCGPGPRPQPPPLGAGRRRAPASSRGALCFPGARKPVSILASPLSRSLRGEGWKMISVC